VGLARRRHPPSRLPTTVSWVSRCSGELRMGCKKPSAMSLLASRWSTLQSLGLLERPAATLQRACRSASTRQDAAAGNDGPALDGPRSLLLLCLQMASPPCRRSVPLALLCRRRRPVGASCPTCSDSAGVNGWRSGSCASPSSCTSVADDIEALLKECARLQVNFRAVLASGPGGASRSCPACWAIGSTGAWASRSRPEPERGDRARNVERKLAQGQ
jgi:hypothetical protein